MSRRDLGPLPWCLLIASQNAAHPSFFSALARLRAREAGSRDGEMRSIARVT